VNGDLRLRVRALARLRAPILRAHVAFLLSTIRCACGQRRASRKHGDQGSLHCCKMHQRGQSSTRAQQSLPGPTMTRRRRECSRQRDPFKQLVAAVDAAHASESVGENADPQVSLELGHDEAGQTAPILFDLRQERLEVPPELSRTGATSPARGGDSSKLQRRTAVALPALRSAADLRRRGPRRWRLFMKRANRSSLGGLTLRRRGSSDSRQPVEQNGKAESRSDPKNHATARLPRHLQLSTSSSSSAVTVAPSSLHLSPFFKCHYAFRIARRTTPRW
jgi:hypothetical protein